MSKITNRLAFFAKIKKRSDDLVQLLPIPLGKVDNSGTISPDNIDRQDFPERRQPYATERYSAEISNSVNFLNPAMQNIVTDEHVKVRAQKVAAGHLGGESKWFINEVMVENHYVRGYSLMIKGWTGKGSVTRKVQVEGSWVINDGPYEYGTEVQVEFVPNTGYHFVSWSDGGLNPHTVTMNDDVVLEVVAEQIPVYTLAFSAAGVGTVAATVNETTVLSPAQVEVGASVAITAIASAGHLFSEWIGYPEGAVISGNIVSFAMPSSAVSITANFIEAPTFQGLKLTNTAVSDYIIATIGETDVQLNYLMDRGSALPYRYTWASADMSIVAFTESRNPLTGATLYQLPTEGSSALGTVVSRPEPTPTSNVLHFKPGTDTGFQSLQYSTDGGTWTNWPEVAGVNNVMIIDVNDGTNNLVIAFDFYSEEQSWYTWSNYPVGGGSKSSWHSATRNVAVGDVLAVVPDTGATVNVTVTGLHYTSALVLTQGEGIPTYAYDSPRSMSDGTIEWYSTSGSTDYIVVPDGIADPGLETQVTFHPEGGSPLTTTLASIAPASSATCAAYPDTVCSCYAGTNVGYYVFTDSISSPTLMIGLTSRWSAVAGDSCMWITEESIGETTVNNFTITPPSDYGTVTFSGDLYLKGVSDTWYGENSANRFWTDGTVNVSGRPSSVVTGNDGPADFSQTNKWELSYLFGDLYDDGNWFKVVDASGLDLSQITLGAGTFGSMFEYASFLTTPPALPATTLAESCYNSMFAGCGSLTSAPVLPASILAGYCYKSMFSGCSNINSITCLATDISAENCTVEWLTGVAEEGTFTWTTTPGATWPGWTTGEDGIPEGWTVNPQPPFQGLKFTNVPGTVYITVNGSNFNYFSCKSTESVTAWCSASTIIYTQSRNPEAGATVYSDPECSTSAGTIDSVDNPSINKLSLALQGSSISSLKYSLNNGDTFQDWTPLAPDDVFFICCSDNKTYSYNSGGLGNCWSNSGSVYTVNRNPAVNDPVYNESGCTTQVGTVLSITKPARFKVEGTTYTDWFKFFTMQSGQTTVARFSHQSAPWDTANVSITPDNPLVVGRSITIEGLEYEISEVRNGTEDTYQDIEFSNSICLKSTNNVWAASLSTAGLVKASGRLTSLLDGSGASPMSLTNINERAFSDAFENLYVIDASGLVLDSPELSSSCYQRMFENNYFIQFAPSISSTTLASGCCAQMYQYCYNLTDSGTLPAHTLENKSYYRMFYECRNLSSITCLATGINASNCISDWVQNVAATGTFHRNPNTWAGWTIGSTSGIPSGWTIDPDLNYLTFEVLSMEGESDNLVLAANGDIAGSRTIEYSKNGGAWTEYQQGTAQTAERISLTTGDKIRFRNTGDVTQFSQSSSDYYQFTHTSNVGARFKVSGDITTLLRPTGNVESIADYCFYSLFNSFVRIVDMSELVLPSTSLAPNCYRGMFWGAAMLEGYTTTVPALPFEGYLPDNCYQDMFRECACIKGPVGLNAYSPYSSGTTSACTGMFQLSGTNAGAGGTIYYIPMGGITAQDWINAANINTTYWTVVS